MFPPELQPMSYRPYVSSPSTLNHNHSHSHSHSHNVDRNPNPNPNPNPSRRSRSSSFAYNGRMAIALLPCAAFLLDLGGTPVIATLTLGLMCSYILDSLNFKPGAFFGVWFSLISAQIAFFFSATPSLFSAFNSVPLGLLATFLCAQTTFLIGIWSSLQFKWIHLENPSIVLSLERLLFASVPISAASLFTWATVSSLGMLNSSYFLLSFNCLFYWLYSLPRPSSFNHTPSSSGGLIPVDVFILAPLDSCFHTLFLLFSPLLFHISSHYSLLSSSISDLFLLFFLPFLFLLYASTRNSLWWITTNRDQLHSIRLVNGAVALLVIVICLQVRVIFHSFGRYIQIPPPFSYLLVTVTMLGGAAAAAAAALGFIADAASSLAFITLATLASTAGAIVVGFPIWVCTFRFLSSEALFCLPVPFYSRTLIY